MLHSLLARCLDHVHSLFVLPTRSGLPEIRHSEHSIRSLKRLQALLERINIALHHLNAETRQVLEFTATLQSTSIDELLHLAVCG